jgi:hypothetical protein
MLTNKKHRIKSSAIMSGIPAPVKPFDLGILPVIKIPADPLVPLADPQMPTPQIPGGGGILADHVPVRFEQKVVLLPVTDMSMDIPSKLYYPDHSILWHTQPSAIVLFVILVILITNYKNRGDRS